MSSAAAKPRASHAQAIDLSALNVSKTPRSAREVAEKKLRQELRAAGDAGASKKTGGERDEDLAEFYRKRQQERQEQLKAAKQKLLLANPTQSLIDCACAAGASRIEDLNFLIEKQVDLDDRSPDTDMTALMHCCKYGGLMSQQQGGAAAAAVSGVGGAKGSPAPPQTQAGLEALVRAGADVDLQNSSGQTALMLAVAYNNPAAVAFLLDHSGARPDIVDHAGRSALTCAYERGLTHLASKLVRALASAPPKVTTVAREKLQEAKRKAAEQRRKEREEKQAAKDKIIQAALAAAKD
jgi:ankyrin repeat protein